MKKAIRVMDYTQHILEQLAQGGVLVTVKDGDKANPITIGWGTIGIQWGKVLFQAYIRECRHSKALLDKAGEFTVNVPLARTDRTREILAFCGTRSGRDVNKSEELRLTLEAGDTVAAPAIRELPLTLECKVIYSQRQDGARMPVEVMKRYYPQWDKAPEDVHTVYYGEVTPAYILE